ncbi:MAG: dienelactone hydrolase family protein, partial [Hyphomicrobiales bacterium]
MAFSSLQSASAATSQQVAFEGAPPVVSEFQKKRAKAQGKEIEPQPGIPLNGDIHLPDGAALHPAVILLHGCETSSAWLTAWTKRLNSWGYAVLTFNSFAPRKVETVCK